MRLRRLLTELAKLSTEQLVDGARAEVVQDEEDGPCPYLVALHERATRDVFEVAVGRLAADDVVDRELGARILRELGPNDETGRRTFTTEAVPLLVDRLHQEEDPGVLRWVISALGYNAANEALADVLPFAGHPEWRVRFHVAAALPALIDPVRPEAAGLDTLQKLLGDDEADTRYYALYALVEEIPGVPGERVAAAFNGCLDDPDDQIREWATDHRTGRT